jgi:hypothetical protein
MTTLRGSQGPSCVVFYPILKHGALLDEICFLLRFFLACFGGDWLPPRVVFGDLKYESSALLELRETVNNVSVSKPLPRWPSKPLGNI